MKAILIISALMVAMLPAWAKTYDELKAERLAQQRDLRRAIEREYEACLSKCTQSCQSKSSSSR